MGVFRPFSVFILSRLLLLYRPQALYQIIPKLLIKLGSWNYLPWLKFLFGCCSKVNCLLLIAGLARYTTIIDIYLFCKLHFESIDHLLIFFHCSYSPDLWNLLSHFITILPSQFDSLIYWLITNWYSSHYLVIEKVLIVFCKLWD